MTRCRLPLLGLALTVLGAGACDWTAFDDLALKAPIRAVPRPDDMDSNLYPTFVLPVTKQPSGRGSAELLVLGRDNVALADLTFGPDGHLGTQTITNDRFVLNGAKVGPLGVAAYLPDPASEVPRIVAVLEEERQPILVTLDSTDASFSVATLGAALTIEVGAITVGDARVAGETDVVIASGKQLIVLPTALAPLAESCDLESAVAALAVGDQWIVAGQSQNGRAWLVKPDYAAAPDELCANRTELLDHSEAFAFGTVVMAADIDDDGTRDIAVSAPQERTIYFYSADDGARKGDAKTLAGATTGCGTTMAVGTLEEQRTLVIGDPGDPGGVAAPGVVWLQSLADLTADPQRLDRPTDDVQRFGQQVGVVTFTGPAGPVDLLWVAAEAVTQGDPGVVYLYFWVQDPASDPRAFQD